MRAENSTAGRMMPLTLQDLLLDVRHALRVFGKTPAFTLVAVLTLMLAIGANVFVFGGAQHGRAAPLEVSDPQSLYQIRSGRG